MALLIDVERLHKELECLAKFGGDVTIDDVIGIKKAMNVVTSQPTIYVPEINVVKWIPCSERLPEENGRYIVTLFSRYNNRYESFDLWYEDGSWYECNYLIMDKIIAWMPLPEPYKGEEK